MTNGSKPAENRKCREQFLRVLKSRIERCGISLGEDVLIVGGSPDDEETLRRAGFRSIRNSGFPGAPGAAAQAGSEPAVIPLDAEAMALPGDSFDLVFAHEVLHHCRSPHRALCEMLRVCRKHAVLLEPNDSMAMTTLTKMGFSFPYELTAVACHGDSGGVRDSEVPNFIHRWNRREVLKTVSSFLPERVVSVDAYPYWDFNATELDLALKKETRIGAITALVGAGNFLSFLRYVQSGLNRVPALRRQGNKFFCCIQKTSDLKPWLARDGSRIVLSPASARGTRKM